MGMGMLEGVQDLLENPDRVGQRELVCPSEPRPERLALDIRA